MSGVILLVDDDPLIRTVISDELSEHGFLVHSAADESQAFEALDTYSDIGVALVDYALPRPVGVGLCRRIVSDYPDIAVALYTGHEIVAGVRLNDDDIPVLSKTLRMDQLAEAVQSLFDGEPLDGKQQDRASRAEMLWRRELKRETVVAVGRAMHNQYDRALREPLPPRLSETVMRLFRMR